MARTEITLSTGTTHEVDGSAADVEAAILGASRGSMMELAWFREVGSGERLGVNPDHVVALRSADGPA